MTRRMLGLLMVCIAVAFAWPANGNAQIKSLIKKKAAAQITGEEKAANTNGPKAPVFGGDLVELAGANLDDFIAAHALENRLIRAFRKELASFKSPEEFETCKRNVAMTPAGQKIALQMASLPENASAAQIQKIIEKMNVDMQSLIKSSCGESINEVWPQYKRSQRMEHFRELASQAFDSAFDARAAARPRGGPSVGEIAWHSAASRKYRIGDERVLVFCRLKDAGKLERDKRGFWFAEDNPGNYYLYSDSEYDDMSMKCKEMEHEEEAG